MSEAETRYMLDTMVVDHIIHEDIDIKIKDLVDLEIEITFTFLLRDEVAASEDFEQEIKNFLNKTDADRISRASTLYGIGGYGSGPYGLTTDRYCKLAEALRAEEDSDKKDALMIEAALKDGDTFVTEENRILDPPEGFPDEVNPEQIMSEKEFVEKINEMINS